MGGAHHPPLGKQCKPSVRRFHAMGQKGQHLHRLSVLRKNQHEWLAELVPCEPRAIYVTKLARKTRQLYR